jgi:nucleoside-diphosphate-sugar epimerase
MKIAITGATGFVGRELVHQLCDDDTADHKLRCMVREPNSAAAERLDVNESVQLIQGELADGTTASQLVDGCDVVIHSAVWRDKNSFQAAPDDIVEYARVNILGTLELIKAAIAAEAKAFVFVSTCAVHDHILNDRPLDEAHPLWANSHYGAHKAAIEKFVHSSGLGTGFPICSIRPTGIYGVMDPVENSKWFDLIRSVSTGEQVTVNRGGKEVHVSDVAKAIRLLIDQGLSDPTCIAGQAFSCYDRYISEFDVANIAREISGSASDIVGQQKTPKHEIDSSKIKNLGMKFGGESLLRKTIADLLRQ